MDIAAFRKRLQQQGQDLEAEIARHQAGVLDDAQAGAQDIMDKVVSSEESDEQLQHADADSRRLIEIQEALARIERGTYGRCIDCGRPIEPNRLEAIPWTLYCLDDQRRHDRLSAPTSEPTM